MFLCQLILTLTLSVFADLAHGRDNLGDARTVDVVRSYGYPAMDYNIITEDGYILGLTHIKSSGTKLPVLMLAGVFAASDMWVMQGPGKDLALLLVDAGHDVWLGNYRGNYYSPNHTELNQNDPEFWNFSFHEIGVYDIPAMVDFVLSQSGSRQVQYVGHSMGCTSFLVMCSVRPEYNSKIQTAALLSPVAYRATSRLSPTFRLVLPQASRITKSLVQARVHNLQARTRGNQKLVDSICGDRNRRLCFFYLSQAYGSENTITDLRKIRTYLKRLLSGASVKIVEHLSQIFKTSTFSYFDYGRYVNIEVYKSKRPPAYPLKNVACPIAIFYSDNDVFLDDCSIGRLTLTLQNVFFTHSIPGYNHIDLIFADNAADLFYQEVVTIFN